MSIYEKIVKAEKEGRSYALATIVNTVGCTPRSAGTKMLVFTDGSTEGTVGGGLAEQLVIKDALSCMRSGRPLLKRYSPKTIKEADMEPDCVKTMDILIEPHASGAVLYLLGSGHVAQAVLPLAVKTGFYTIVADTRAMSDYREALAGADEIIQIDSFDDLSMLEPTAGAYYIVCTSSHATDGQALGAAMGQDAAYIGMLGAKHKFLPIFNDLRKAGYTDEELMQIYAPIGLDIGGEGLDEIAVGVIAEMMAVKYGRSGGFSRDKKRAELFPDAGEK